MLYVEEGVQVEVKTLASSGHGKHSSVLLSKRPSNSLRYAAYHSHSARTPSSGMLAMSAYDLGTYSWSVTSATIASTTVT